MMTWFARFRARRREIKRLHHALSLLAYLPEADLRRQWEDLMHEDRRFVTQGGARFSGVLRGLASYAVRGRWPRKEGQ